MKSLLVLLTLSSLLALFFLDNQASYVQGYETTLKSSVAFQPFYINNAFPFVDYSNILIHVKNLSILDSRVTGYPGSERAADYITNALKSYGLNVFPQEYQTFIPIDANATINVLSPEYKVLKVYALWPNSIQACPIPPKGIEGNLIYVGDGSLANFNGKNIEGAIVLMDFNSGDNWLNAAKFGAKAVIFLESWTNRFDAMKKFIQTPIYFPRLYVRSDDAAYLRNLADHGAAVKVTSRMLYRTLTARNIIGVVNGTEKPNDIIIISAHYDSWSVVPSLSPGAEEAVSIASLLELAKYYAEHPALRTIWFVAFSGHWQASAGAREFVEQYFYSTSVQSGEVRPLMQINLDLSTDYSGIDILNIGSLYRASPPAIQFNVISGLLDKEILPAIDQKLQMDSSRLIYMGLTEDRWWGTQGEPYILDSEPAAASGIAAFSIMTSRTSRLYWHTPFDNFDNVNIDNLKPQLTMSSAIVDYFVNVKKFDIETQWVPPSRVVITSGGNWKGIVTLEGSVSSYNMSNGWYIPIPHAIVQVLPFGTSVNLPFSTVLTRADENGTFAVHGLAISAMRGFTGLTREYLTLGWRTNDTDGSLEYTPDLGQYGAQAAPSSLTIWKHPEFIKTIVFKSANVVLHDLIDPQTMRRGQILDPRISTSFYTSMGNVVPYDFVQRSIPVFYGSYYNLNEKVAMIFVLPEERFSICYTVIQAGELRIVGILVNASETNPEGYGYSAKEGETLFITFTPLRFLHDMHLISQFRYNNLKSFKVQKTSTTLAIDMARDYLIEAEKHYGTKSYDQAYSLALVGWSVVTAAYVEEVMPLFFDLGNTSIVYIALLIAFVVLFERLIIHGYGKSRYVGVAVTAATAVIAFYFLHPSLRVISNTALSFLGILMGAFLIIVLSLFFSETSSIIEKTSLRILGKHKFKSTPIMTELVFLPSLSIENMRRRRMRTFLTLITLVIVSVALTSLTSSSSVTTIRASQLPGESTYNGVLIKRFLSIPPSDLLDEPCQAYLKGLVGDNMVICPRVWYYPESIRPMGASTEIKGPSGNTTIVHAILGISSKESEILLNVNIGRRFLEGDYCATILPESLRNSLRVDVGDSITWRGMSLVVVGFFDPSTVKDDLDGYPLTPINPKMVNQLNIFQVGERGARPTALAWGSVLVVPYRLALDLGGYVANMAVHPNVEDGLNFTDLTKVAHDLAISLNAGVYVGWKGGIYNYSKITSWFVIGLAPMIIILVVGFTNVMVTILGNVKEREREIYVYSTVGQNPRGVSILFLTESAIYGVLSAFLGYVIGSGVNMILVEAGFLPSDFTLNFSSFSVAIVVCTLLLVTLASTAYPMVIASRIVTPSLERRWRIVTKGREREWAISFPLTVTSQLEAYEILEYIYEYFEGMGKETTTHSVREIKSVSFEEMVLNLLVALPPFESGTTQEVSFSARWFEFENRYRFEVDLKMLTGNEGVWKTANYGLVDSLRKQLLLWRSLSREERERYRERVKARM